MSARIPVGAEEASTVPTPRDRGPVPAPPRMPLAKPRAGQQTPRSRYREHEVQRLIRDLADLADSERAQVP